MATDQKQPPTIDTAAKGVDLVKAEAFLASPSGEAGRWSLWIIGGGSTGLVIMLSFLVWRLVAVSNLQLAVLAKDNAAVQEALLRQRSRRDAPVLRLWREEDLTRPVRPEFIRVRERHGEIPVEVVEPMAGIEVLPPVDIGLE